MPSERELREIANAIAEITRIVREYNDGDLRVLVRMLENAEEEAQFQAHIQYEQTRRR